MTHHHRCKIFHSKWILEAIANTFMFGSLWLCRVDDSLLKSKLMVHSPRSVPDLWYVLFNEHAKSTYWKIRPVVLVLSDGQMGLAQWSSK